jgi:hypothetical protein
MRGSIYTKVIEVKKCKVGLDLIVLIYKVGVEHDDGVSAGAC